MTPSPIIVPLSLHEAHVTPLEITVMVIDPISRAATLYRWIDQENTEVMELSEAEITALITAYQKASPALAFALSNSSS